MTMALPVADPVAAAKIRSQISQFTKASGITVSPEARRIITVVLEAMRTDPHRNWTEVDRAKVSGLRSQILNDLSATLSQIAAAEHVTGQLNSFDVLHWLTDNFVSWCPVDK